MMDWLIELLIALTLAISVAGLAGCTPEEAVEQEKSYRSTLYDSQGDIIDSWVSTEAREAPGGLILVTTDGEVYVSGGILVIEEL